MYFFQLLQSLLTTITNFTKLTGAHKLCLAELAVAGADSIDVVLVELTAACVGEVAGVVGCPALCHFAGVVLSCGHVVEGVVGGLPVEDNYVAGAVVDGLRVCWCARDCMQSHTIILLKQSYLGGNPVSSHPAHNQRQVE